MEGLGFMMFLTETPPVVQSPPPVVERKPEPVVSKKSAIATTSPAVNAKKFPYITGFCGNGQHENSKLLSKAGASRVACRGKYEFRFCAVQCECWCHALFAAAGVTSDSPLSDTTDATDATESSDSGDPRASETAPSEPTTIPSSAIPTQRSTYWSWLVLQDHLEPQLKRLVMKLIFDQESEFVESAENIKERRKRGSLEYNVEAVCRLWLESKLPYKSLIPTDVGMLINAMDPPSPGAIHAVFTRWNEQGLAEVAHSPFRFLSFTSLVGEFGIDDFRRRQQRQMARNEKGFF